MVVLLCVGASVRLCVPTSLGAQDNHAIRAAVRLAAEGRSDSARALVTRELARAQPGAPAYVEALFFRGRLALLGDSAVRDFRRVALEYPTAPWADDALLELAQLAFAAGDPAGALELVARLRGDYPGSELAPLAALWGARAAFEVGEPRGACALLDSARAESALDVELGNQLAFYQQRCTPSVLAARSDTSAAGLSFLVQAFAARTEAEAEGIVRRLAQASLAARVYATDSIYRVRLGPYATERDARLAADAARRVIGGAPFVVRQP